MSWRFLGIEIRDSVEGSSLSSRRNNYEVGSAVISNEARTTHSSPSGLRRLLSSRCILWVASASVFGLSLMMRTRPKLDPTFFAHATRWGHFSAFAVHTPSLSGLPLSQNPWNSMSPNADAFGAKLVSPPLFQSMYSSAIHSSLVSGRLS